MRTHSEARRTYAANSSELRGLARHSKDPAAALKRICADRAFWRGDTWILPATPGAIAALDTIEARVKARVDLLSVFPDVVKAFHGPIPTDAAVAVHRAILAAMRLGATPSLP